VRETSRTIPPQIPPFPSKSVSAKIESKEPRAELSDGNRPLGGGNGDEAIVRGGREGQGCEEGVSLGTVENTNTILNNRARGQFTSSSDSTSKSPGICKIDNARSRTASDSTRVQRSAKTWGTGHLKYTRGESNNSTYISSSRNSSLGNSLGNSLHACNSLELSRTAGEGNSLGNSSSLDPRCSPHTTTTVSLGTQHIIKHTADFLLTPSRHSGAASVGLSSL